MPGPVLDLPSPPVAPSAAELTAAELTADSAAGLAAGLAVTGVTGFGVTGFGVTGFAVAGRAGAGAVLGVDGYANLDYAATAPCHAAAADAVARLLPWYASVHRGAGELSRRCTDEYESARRSVARFVDARADDHVIFTRNTTDALNLLARAVPAGTTAVGWAGEHHASLLPWRRAVRLPVPDSPGAAVRGLAGALAQLDGPVLVCVTGASNVTGEVWPVADLARVAHRYGARIAVDAAQLAPHRPVGLAALDLDYLALSGHKLYAPFGAGVLAGRADWLDAAPPYLAGGGASAHVGDATHDVRWHRGPARHEAGTPNLLGAVALAAVCDWLRASDRAALAAHEAALVDRLLAGLARLDRVAVLRTFAPGHDRVGIVSFAVAGIDSAEVSAHLARYRIGVRDGLFCAHPLVRRLLWEAAPRAAASRPAASGLAASGLAASGLAASGLAASGAAASGSAGTLPPTAVRASVGLGSTAEHVDRLLAGLADLLRAG
jgi:selenocysteine lyase/cysteine desulfurase